MRREIALGVTVPEQALFDRLGRVGRNRKAMEAAAAKAIEVLHEAASLRAIIADVTNEEFREIFIGEGLNHYPNPLERIVQHATRLALFALTLGEGAGNAIDDLFAKKLFLLGYLLDQAASLASEQAVQSLERDFETATRGANSEENLCVLSYSPGYCGWHVSGQKALFKSLQPAEIGIKLNQSLLMTPLKSVTGVLVAAEPAIHRFTADYVFCKQCQDRTCRVRIKRLIG